MTPAGVSRQLAQPGSLSALLDFQSPRLTLTRYGLAVDSYRANFIPLLEVAAMNEQPETVQTVHDTPDTSLRVRFMRNGSDNPKAPKYNALVWLPFPLVDVVAPFPIFQDAKDGAYSVTLPGSKGFP